MSAESLLEFRCCDTSWRVRARGPRAKEGVEAARATALALERRLNAFDASSAVAQLHREGSVEDAHVAAILARAEEYRVRTGGVFDVARGELEHAVKAHIRDGTPLVPAPTRATWRVEGSRVFASAPLDLNGIAKGYIVDQAHAALLATGADGFVDGGGDIARPDGPVGIESPTDPGKLLGVIDTSWNVATSGRARRRRGAVDHLYDPRTGRVGARHDQVTVLARRDCTEADVLATTLAVMPLDEGYRLATEWAGVEALWVKDGRMHATPGFERHV